MTRRDLFRLLGAAWLLPQLPLSAAIDRITFKGVTYRFWPNQTPLRGGNPNIGQIVAREWERVIRERPIDNVYESQWMYEQLKRDA